MRKADHERRHRSSHRGHGLRKAFDGTDALAGISGSGYDTFREVMVTAGASLRVDLPNLCK
jgi:hypothetical protein